MVLLECRIAGMVRSKKNSKRIARTRAGKPFILSSIASDAWSKFARLQLRMAWGGAMPIETPVALCARFYIKGNRPDLDNALSSICDVLQEAGVIRDDRQVESFDGSRIVRDRQNARVEIILSSFEP